MMTKTKILIALTILSVFMLNFITYEEAQEVLYDTSYAGYKEYFDAHYPMGYPSSDADAAVEMTSTIRKNSEATLSPYGKATSDAHTPVIVEATIYKALHPMTDITASGITLDTINAGKYRYIAVSRDLAEEGFTFGTRVMISGTGTHDGIWVVEDLMHQRWEKRIDFLSDADAPLNRWSDVKILKLD